MIPHSKDAMERKEPYFKFTEAMSFVVNCELQDEIDYYWEKLSIEFMVHCLNEIRAPGCNTHPSPPDNRVGLRDSPPKGRFAADRWGTG
jgi:hypothetical protein